MRILLPLGFILLAGCFMTAPNNNAEFGAASLNDLNGKYQNLGEGGLGVSGKHPAYLSQLIWPKMKNHSSIELVEVQALKESMLLVRAIAGGKVVAEDQLIQDKDFTLKDGRIVLKQGVDIYPKYQVPMLGVGYEKAELGIDKKGEGKYRYSGGLAGLAYIFIPIAGGQSNEVRFSRLK